MWGGVVLVTTDFVGTSQTPFSPPPPPSPSTSILLFTSITQFLAVGTSKGMLLVYEVIKLRSGDIKCSVLAEVSAHLPQPGEQDQRFGQLTKQ